MIAALQFILDWWLVLAWIAAVLVAWNFLGWRGALVVVSLGAANLVFKAGWDRAEESRKERDRKRSDGLAKKYSDIDSRGVDRSTVIKRLRDGRF